MIRKTLNFILERFEPKDWMRPFISLGFLYWIDKHSDTCWTYMVMWKEFGGYSWMDKNHCLMEGDDYCYCNKYCKEFFKKNNIDPVVPPEKTGETNE